MAGAYGSGGARRKFASVRLPALTVLPDPPTDLTAAEASAWREIGECAILMRRLTAGMLLALRECSCTRAELDTARRAEHGVVPANIVRQLANSYWRQLGHFGLTPATEPNTQSAPDEAPEEGAARFR